MAGSLEQEMQESGALEDDKLMVGKYGFLSPSKHESLHTAGAQLMLIEGMTELILYSRRLPWDHPNFIDPKLIRIETGIWVPHTRALRLTAQTPAPGGGTFR